MVVIYTVVFFLQFTIHVQATQIGPVAAPRLLLSPARACWKLLLLLPPRHKAPLLKPALHQTNRSAEKQFVFDKHSDHKSASHLRCWFTSAVSIIQYNSPQIFQGNRRTFQGQGYHSGGQRYNGGSYHDRNAGRANHRYQSDGSSSGPTSQHSNNSRGPPRSSTSSYNQDRPSHNGLPQRLPRTHCPWHWKPCAQSKPPTNPCTPLPTPSPCPPLSPTNSFQWRIEYQFTYFCQLSGSATSLHQSIHPSNLKSSHCSVIALPFAFLPSWLRQQLLSLGPLWEISWLCYWQSLLLMSAVKQSARNWQDYLQQFAHYWSWSLSTISTFAVASVSSLICTSDLFFFFFFRLPEPFQCLHRGKRSESAKVVLALTILSSGEKTCNQHYRLSLIFAR